MVTAFGLNPDGKATLLRPRESAGQSGELTVTLPGYSSTLPVNLRGERTGDPIQLETGMLGINLSAFAPASIVPGR
jgi:hypothetical protein